MEIHFAKDHGNQIDIKLALKYLGVWPMADTSWLNSLPGQLRAEGEFRWWHGSNWEHNYSSYKYNQHRWTCFRHPLSAWRSSSWPYLLKISYSFSCCWPLRREYDSYDFGSTGE
jgi:hypothetical protein